MAPEARSTFGAPMFEPEVFQKQMHSTEVLVTLLGLFGALIVIQRPGIVPLDLRRYAPDYCAQRRASTNHGKQL